MGKVLIIGAGGVGGVVTHKCAMVPEVFNEIVLASRTLEKCEKIAGQISQPIQTAQVDADNTQELVELIKKVQPELIINGETVGVEELKTRGKTTLYQRRKSFSFSLTQKVGLYHYDKMQQFKKFHALSLSMDKYYIRNRISFKMMKDIGIFSLYNTYSELEINGQSEGIYLLVERPQDWALKNKNSPCLTSS